MSVLPEVGSDRQVGVPLVRALGTHGERAAIITPDGGTLTYAGLDGRVAEVLDSLGTRRRLVLVTASNELDPLVAYLAALRGGHPVLLAPRDDPAATETLRARFDPDVTLTTGPDGWALREHRDGTAHDLHPDLALLLPTSGSTGEPKLVRLSAAGVQANAESIAGYLDIRQTDRAATTLPLQYCYGLSVVHSNLLRGAALLLSEHAIVDEAFWSMFTRHGGTSVHGVPYTFDLLDGVGFADRDLPSLRYVTQAGGRLAPERVRHYAELGARSGWRFVVMYGQTEATARMAYLPPELAAAHPGAIGVPIPGGSLRLAPSDEPGVGELLYRGPNVMLGYAHRPADLAAGREVDELATGDIARRTPEGLYELVGRRSRFVKLFGRRIDLDGVEAVLRADGTPAACTGSDEGLVVAVGPGADPRRVARAVAGRLHLPRRSVHVPVLAELPRLPTGKIDYPGVAALAAPPPVRRGWPWAARRAGNVRGVYARVLGTTPAAIDPEATFVALGGDSLTYVEASLELADVLGRLPPDWHLRPVRELEGMAGGRRSRTAIETSVVLRAVAIVLVVGSHVGVFGIRGGAHLLLALAGWSFARFALAPGGGRSTSRRIVAGLVGVAVPTVLWIGLRAVTEDDVDAVNMLLLNYLLDPAAWGYWFVEVLVQILAVLALAFSAARVRGLETRFPFGFPAVLLGAAVLVGAAHQAAGNEFYDRFMSTPQVLWLFVLGWLAQRAHGVARTVVVAAAVLLLVPGFFGDPIREAVVGVGLLLVLLVPLVWLPRVVVRVVGPVAAASLYIYLTHYAVYPSLLGRVPLVVALAACVGVGIAVQLLVAGLRCRVTRLRARRRADPGAAATADPGAAATADPGAAATADPGTDARAGPGVTARPRPGAAVPGRLTGR